MLTPEIILSQPTTLTATNKRLILILLKKNPYYHLEIINSGDTASTKLNSIDDTQAQMLNALLSLVQTVGTTKIAIKKDEDALFYDTEENLLEISNEIFLVLYDWKSYLDPTIDPGDGIIPENGVYGSWAAVGQRHGCSCSRIPCSCLLGSGHKPRNGFDKCGC